MDENESETNTNPGENVDTCGGMESDVPELAEEEEVQESSTKDDKRGEMESGIPELAEEEGQASSTEDRDPLLFASLAEAFQEASSSVSRRQRRKAEDDVHNLFTGSDEEQSPSSEVASDTDAGGGHEEGGPTNQGSSMIENNDEGVAEISSEDKNSCDVKKDDSSLEQAYKVFVSNLPQGYLQSELLGLFQYYGKVLECQVFAKNYAFVYLEEEECALKAMEGLHGVEIRGCKIKVKKSWQDGNDNVKRKDTNLQVETFKIFMGHLPESVTKEQISGLVEPFGRVVEIEIRKGNTAFVHMETEDGGIKAMRELNGKPFPDTLDHPIVVVECQNHKKPVLPIIKLKVTNIPVSVTADAIRCLFVPYGLVLNVKITSTSSPTECGYNAAIVHLEQFGNIRSAINNLTGYSIDDGATLHVEPFFEKEEPVEPIHTPKPKLNSYKRQKIQPMPNFNEPYGRVSRNYNNAPPPPFNSPRPVLRQPYNRQHHHPQPLLRLIPMPSRVELESLPGPRRGRVLLGQGFSNPPFQRTGIHDNPFANSFDNNNYNDAWTDTPQEFEDQSHDSQYEHDTYDNDTLPMNDYGNNYNAPPPAKFPRTTQWGNSGPSYSQSLLEQQYGLGNNNLAHNQGKDPFPDFPSPNKFPKPPAHQSLMSVQIPTSDEQDWSADLSISTFSQFSHDFTSDEPTEPSSLRAVPFDYSQIRKNPKGLINQQFTGRNSTKFKWGNKSGGGGGGKNKKSRRPGLGTMQQQKKTATQTGSNQPGTSSIPPLMGDSELHTNAATPAPSYFQQNWSFSKAKQKQQQFKKPSAKQMKDAEEEQKRQYADYLKQKPWLTTQIPGTIRRVEK